MEEGLAAGQQGNAFFNPQDVVTQLPDVTDMLGEDPAELATFFIDAGYEDWMDRLGRYFTPAAPGRRGAVLGAPGGEGQDQLGDGEPPQAVAGMDTREKV